MFDFSYNGPDGADISRTPILANALDAYLTEQYGEDRLIGGELAFDDDKNLVGVRVVIDFALGEEPNMPYGDGEAAWDSGVEFFRGLGVTSFMTFFRRQHGFGNADPNAADEHILTTTVNLAPGYGLNYIGHLITDGEYHGLMLDRPDPMSQLMRTLDDQTKAQIGRDLLASLVKLGSTPPEVLRAVEIGIEHYETGTAPTPEDLAAVEQAKELVRQRIEADEGENNVEMDGLLRSIEAHVRQPRPTSPFDVPDINPRPDVPPAFYH